MLIFLTSFALKFSFHVWLINSQLEAVCTIILKTFPKFPVTVAVNVVTVKPFKVEVYRENTAKMQKITRLYSMISENADLTNQSMGFTLIVMAAVAVLSIIGGFYRILMNALGENPGNIVGA